MLTFFRPHVLNEILIILHKNVVALLNPYPNKPWFLAPLAVAIELMSWPVVRPSVR